VIYLIIVRIGLFLVKGGMTI